MELAAQVGPIQMPWHMWHLGACCFETSRAVQL